MIVSTKSLALTRPLIKSNNTMSQSKAERLFKTDKYLSDLDYAKWSKPASDESVEKTAKALVAKGHAATVVSSRKEALDTLIALMPEGSTIMNASSTSLEEIGYIDFLKANPGKWNNLKETVLAAPKEKQDELRRLSMAPNFWVSSITAVSEEGDFTVCDLTGTRVGGFITSDKTVIVIGANKVVPTYVDCAKRTHEFCLGLESARAREVYKVPGSAVNNYLAIRGSNPWGGQGHFVFIIVKGDSLGF